MKIVAKCGTCDGKSVVEGIQEYETDGDVFLVLNETNVCKRCGSVSTKAFIIFSYSKKKIYWNLTGCVPPDGIIRNLETGKLMSFVKSLVTSISS